MSSEYGWTDEEIGELPLARFRQIAAAIQLRRFAAQRDENSRFSWLGRTIATYVAAGFQVAEGQENTALTSAQTLTLDDVEAAMLGAPSAQPQGENQNGSFEKFMLKMGANGGSSPFQ